MPLKEPHYPHTHYDRNQPLPEGKFNKKQALKPKHDTKHCWTINDILHQGLDYSLLQNRDGSNTTKHHNVRDRRQLAKQIAWEFLTTMLDEVIATGDHYLLPTINYSLLRIVAASQAITRQRFANGRYQMLDPMATDFNTYELRLDYKPRYGTRHYHRACRIDLPRYYQLAKLVNRGDVAYDLN